MSASPNRRQAQRAATAQRIYEIALGLFASNGYEATTVAAITEAAGVAKGTFFVHFASKEAILAYFGQRQIERLEAAIAAEAGFSVRPARAQLHFIYRTLAAGIDSYPELARQLTLVLLQSTRAFDEQLLGVDPLDRQIERVALVGQARGELRSDTSLADMVPLLRGTYFLAVLTWLARPSEPFAPVAARMLDLVLDGLTQ